MKAKYFSSDKNMIKQKPKLHEFVNSKSALKETLTGFF